MDIWQKLRGDKDKRPRAVDTGAIAHSEIYLPQPKGARITEHIFQNPDETSSVAAVSCKLHDGNLQLELYSRDGRFEQTAERIDGQTVEDVHPFSLGSFPSKSPIHDKSHCLIGFKDGVMVSEHRKPDAAALQKLATCFDALESTPILSGNSTMREAMVRKIYETIPLLEATVQRATPSSNAIG